MKTTALYPKSWKISRTARANSVGDTPVSYLNLRNIQAPHGHHRPFRLRRAGFYVHRDARYPRRYRVSGGLRRPKGAVWSDGLADAGGDTVDQHHPAFKAWIECVFEFVNPG
jgi:hypothetical protein